LVDYGLALRILSLATRDEYLKNAILRFVVQEFKDDLRRMLGLSLTGIKLSWSLDFENFLVERKKRRKVRDVETLKYYKSLFIRYLEGRELSEELIEYVVNHPNRWVRNILRHYIQYLYYRRKITPETFGWLMEVVPSRGYKLDVRPYPIDLEDVKETLKMFEEKHNVYYIVYRVMLESGARFEHVLRMIETWSPSEHVEIPGVDLETRRLVCFEDKGFCRYYMGLRSGSKPCEWVYMPEELVLLIEKHRGTNRRKDPIAKYAREHGLLFPKMFRKLSWRILVMAIGDRDIARFI